MTILNESAGGETVMDKGAREKLLIFPFRSALRKSDVDLSEVSPCDDTAGNLEGILKVSFGKIEGNQSINSDCDSIFERSVQEKGFGDQRLSMPPKCRRCSITKAKNCSHNSSVSLPRGQCMRMEDCIPPALDATTSVLNDKDASLDEVEMVYSKRRNLSVQGLSLALGRPSSSRKGSSLSSSLLCNPLSPVQALGSSLSLASAPETPVSLPRLGSSKSSLNFYSYAEMLNEEKKPNRTHSQSQPNPFMGNYSKRKVGLASNNPSLLSRQLLNRENSKTNKNFVILPETSDSDEHHSETTDVHYRDQASSWTVEDMENVDDGDDESLVASSVGHCLRENKIQIDGL